MSMKNWMKNFFYLDEDEEASEAQQPRPQQQKTVDNNIKQTVKSAPKERKFNTIPKDMNTPNLVSIQNVQKSSKVILIEPRVYAEAQDISEHLKSKKAVIVNLQRIDKEQGIRIIDFLSGTVYALGGDIQRIGTDIFLCAPDSVEVDGAISDYYYNDLD
ncbi:cell division protein SepF [Psychrobacillus psychrodurans]|uniref:cell division protein SepF n=1 Tax=Psychrobacillus psychrodurans TaxID=126157 RepID=UPI0008DF400E|nr:cell division protein SepF [Psychrobacillus psychrodurans]MCZ8539457.1 cell division protein SepF [Psychrobacillus psychrodurans]SFM39321.1 cell division inhibitor SepF [Psychrobacillus psychrodurans]